jgi:hypothetical protein
VQTVTHGNHPPDTVALNLLPLIPMDAQVGQPTVTDTFQLPGPGAYSPTETRTGKKLDFLAETAGHASAFRAPGHQLTMLGPLDSPPPTKYSLSDPWAALAGGPGPVSGGSLKAGSGAGKGSHAGTSSFASRSVASLAAIPPILFLDTDAQGRGGASMKPDTGPGPGSYDAYASCTLERRAERAASKPSSSFRMPEFTHQTQEPQARTKLHVVPGREQSGASGSSSIQPASNTTAGTCAAGQLQLTSKGVSAPFKSRSPGHADYNMQELARAPGPAYYTSKLLPARRSFHLNAAKSFH